MREKQTDSWLHNYEDVDKKERLQNSIVKSHYASRQQSSKMYVCSSKREVGYFKQGSSLYESRIRLHAASSNVHNS